MKNVYTLVDDIYKLMESKEVAEGIDLEAHIETFGENVKDLMRKEFGEKRNDNRKLRMSNIGISAELRPELCRYPTALSLTLKVFRLMGLENSKMVVWLMMTRLATLLKLRAMQQQKEKLSTAG